MSTSLMCFARCTIKYQNYNTYYKKILLDRTPSFRFILASAPVANSSTFLKNRDNNAGDNFRSDWQTILSAVGLTIGCGVFLFYTKRTVYTAENKLVKGENASVPENAGGNKSNFSPDKVYTIEEIRKHNTKETGIWMTYKMGVYDVTNWVDDHPGGEIIMAAAGNAMDPYWNVYSFHKHEAIEELLENYRIGSLAEEGNSDSGAVIDDPFKDDPKRNFPFIVNSAKPFNAEPPLPILIENFITPSDTFYIRNHMPVPIINADEYKLEISGLGVKNTTLTLNDLKTKFAKVTVDATVQCAGNRRNEMSDVKPVKGLSWGPGAIGNARWSGVRLIDVLKYCGLEDYSKIQHIQFEGLDFNPAKISYGASIPFERILNPHSNIILAYEMNNSPLTPDHGFPIRVIVPGTVGARMVKWLGKIILSEEESQSQWQQNDYKGFSPSVDWDTVDFKSAAAIQQLPVISAICDPLNKQTVKIKNGKLTVKGYAYSGGGSKILRVDLTADRGKNWKAADIVERENVPAGRCYSWVLWKAELEVGKDVPEEVEIWAKAVDSNYNVQPETVANIWNLRGVLVNAYHRIRVKIER